MEQKLAALAEERQRTKNVINYKDLTRPVDSAGDGRSIASNSKGSGEGKGEKKNKKVSLQSSKSLHMRKAVGDEAAVATVRRGTS